METMEDQINDLKEVCRHARVLRGNCTSCGQVVRHWYGVAFDYVQEGLWLSCDEIKRLKDTNSKKLFAERKLQLVLDLDNTLLHSKLVEKLSPGEKYLKSQANSCQNVSNDSLFSLGNPERLVKLRPFVRNFLKEASTMFEMYIFTMGSKLYAKLMVELLDPEGKYFENRVISRENLINQGEKSLDLVLGHESGVIIIDDSPSVWPDDEENLISILSYSYFSKNQEKKSYYEKKEDESESCGALAYVMMVLKAIHALYFNEEISGLPSRDVRMLMQMLRSKVLEGCVIFFSRIDQYDYSSFIIKAKELGAECIEILDSSVTHVVSAAKMTGKAMEDFYWAEKEKKFLVNPQWINYSYFLWVRQEEDRFSVLKA